MVELKITAEKAQSIFEDIDYLSGLLDDRVVDLAGVKGGMQARHNYIFYRRLLWEIKHTLRDGLEEIDTNQQNQK